MSGETKPGSIHPHASPAMQIHVSVCLARAPIAQSLPHCRLPLPQRQPSPARAPDRPMARPHHLRSTLGHPLARTAPWIPHGTSPSPSQRSGYPPPIARPRPCHPRGRVLVMRGAPQPQAAPLGRRAASPWQRSRHAEPSTEVGQACAMSRSHRSRRGAGRERARDSPAEPRVGERGLGVEAAGEPFDGVAVFPPCCWSCHFTGSTFCCCLCTFATAVASSILTPNNRYHCFFNNLMLFRAKIGLEFTHVTHRARSPSCP